MGTENLKTAHKDKENRVQWNVTYMNSSQRFGVPAG